MNNKTSSDIDSIEKTDDVDISEIFILIWRFKVLLIITIMLFGTGSVLYSLSLPNTYTSATLMKTSDSASDSSSSSSALGSLASITGLDLSAPSGSGNKTDLAVATILSRDFLRHLLKMPGDIGAKISAVKAYDPVSQEIIFDESKFDSATRTWINSPPSYVEMYKDYVDMIDTSLDKYTGYITIKLTHQSPFVAQELLSIIIKEANLLARDLDKNKSRDALAYLSAQLDTIQQKDIRLSINQLIGVEMRKLTLANIEENYLVEPIDSPYVPHRKAGPQRAKISIIGTIAGFVFVLFSLILWYFIFDRNQKK
jgi:uncharacterized protein involved in exopolysaccharide biosynthesis